MAICPYVTFISLIIENMIFVFYTSYIHVFHFMINIDNNYCVCNTSHGETLILIK